MRAIDADELWHELGILYEHNKGHVNWNDAILEIKNAPTIEPKKGKWILPNNPIAKANDEWICSGCHYLIGGKHNYCPNCGSYNGGDKE